MRRVPVHEAAVSCVPAGNGRLPAGRLRLWAAASASARAGRVYSPEVGAAGITVVHGSISFVFGNNCLIVD